MPEFGPNEYQPLPQFKIEQNLPKMVYIIPDFLVLHLDENLMKKLQMHENLHKNVFIHIFMQFFMSFYGGQLKHQICYSFTLLISYMVFNPFKMAIQFF